MTKIPKCEGTVSAPVNPRMRRRGTESRSWRSAMLEGHTTDISAPESMRKL
jgi:hypothetical protein